MGLFPQSFIDDLKAQADIVQVVQDHVPLKKAGNSYKGLCPFHSERDAVVPRPSRQRDFSTASGAGSVATCSSSSSCRKSWGFKTRCGNWPGASVSRCRNRTPSGTRPPTTEREAHARCRTRRPPSSSGRVWRMTIGRTAREHLDARDVTRETTELLGLGFAPPTRDSLIAHLRARGYSDELLLRSGLAVGSRRTAVGRPVPQSLSSSRSRGTPDRSSLSAHERCKPEQQPKYLNSPETRYLFKGAHAVRAASLEIGPPQGRVRGTGRGLLRPRAGGAGRGHPGRRCPAVPPSTSTRSSCSNGSPRK